MKLIDQLIISKTHCNETVKNQRERENPKSNQKRKNCNLQRNTHQAISGFLSRNPQDQETMEWHIQSAKRKQFPEKQTNKQINKAKNKNKNKTALSGKVILQIQKTNK